MDQFNEILCNWGSHKSFVEIIYDRRDIFSIFIVFRAFKHKSLIPSMVRFLVSIVYLCLVANTQLNHWTILGPFAFPDLFFLPSFWGCDGHKKQKIHETTFYPREKDYISGPPKLFAWTYGNTRLNNIMEKWFFSEFQGYLSDIWKLSMGRVWQHYGGLQRQWG